LNERVVLGRVLGEGNLYYPAEFNPILPFPIHKPTILLDYTMGGNGQTEFNFSEGRKQKVC